MEIKDRNIIKPFVNKCQFYLKSNDSLNAIERLEKLKALYHSFIIENSCDAPIAEIDRLWDILTECFSLYEKGLSYKAIELLYTEYFLKYLEQLSYKLLSIGQSYYRMRYSETGTLFSNEEMFHVPSSQRHIIGNSRFSISGMPMLYLGTSSYICWEELGCPVFDNCNLVQYRLKRDCDVILVEPIWQVFDDSRIMCYPLSYGCFLEVNHKKDPYKAEYVIPQLLMQCIFRYNQEHPDSKLSGVKYLSSKAMGDNSMFPFEPYAYYDVALCASEPFTNGYSSYLQDLFHMSDPITYARLKLYKYNFFEELVARQSLIGSYSNSIFHLMEMACLRNPLPKS